MPDAVTLDAGALIALERGDRRVATLLDSAERHGASIVIPATALAQAWRDGRQQARLSRLLKSPTTTVEALDLPLAKATGTLCGLAGTSDIADAHVVVVARQHRAPILTSDPDDLRHLDTTARIVQV